MKGVIRYKGIKLCTDPDGTPGSGTSRGIKDHKHEIRLFKKVLRDIQNRNNPTMIELGCLWAAWSLFFRREFPNGKNILVEVVRSKLNFGEKNFKLNGYDYESHYGGVCLSESKTFKNGEECGPELDLLKIIGDQTIDLIHMDIEGSELAVVELLSPLLYNHKIKNLVIATHSNYIHNEVAGTLYEHRYTIKIHENFNNGTDGYIYASSY